MKELLLNLFYKVLLLHDILQTKYTQSPLKNIPMSLFCEINIKMKILKKLYMINIRPVIYI